MLSPITPTDVADAFRSLLLDAAVNGAWSFTRDRPAQPMCPDMAQAMRFAVRSAQQADGLVVVAR